MEIMKEITKRIPLQSYSDYREFLRDLYQKGKKEKRGFSFRLMSKSFGFRSPNFIKLVIEGDRNLTEESINQISEGLGLNQSKTNYFKALVLYNQACSTDEKNKHLKVLVRHQSKKGPRKLSPEQYRYFSHWYYVAIRELISTKDFTEDPSWIAGRLSPTIEPHQAKKAIETLLKLGLARRDKNGKLIVTDATISTPNETFSSIIAKFHRDILDQAKRSIDLFKSDERELNAVTIGVSKKGAKRVKGLIQKFREDLIDEVSRDAASEDVYQFSVQFFPLVKTTKNDKDTRDE